ncbi:nicotinate phosphoribosyltransferase [Paucisalibacillus sp. EB02]|uniref:nicotinate phosphoribosyltransferase n=1 Tax=Paucisalibacillus sp. EB02 TaxID=1347087 RepID=UPI0004B16961|nr:nicotinate phosphoribosyltransferase [Paucisalibacillus sp. EB02]
MNYMDDSLALHTDLYQINMAETYWADNVHERRAVFDLYFRKLPFGNGYAVFAGLERVIKFIQDFKFSETDIRYLAELGYKEDFLDYLKTIRFTGSIKSMQEGEIVFGNEPLLRVEATLVEAQLLETALLNIINYQTLIATKASRIKHLAMDKTLMEFGSRRAQELDAAIWGTRAAFIGGFHATSNVRAGKLFGIPVAGTHSHAMVQAYQDEYVAFKKYAERHQNCVFLVDTYDTLKSGVPNAIRVAKEFKDKIKFLGVRLDSGDLAYLSKETRKMLDQAGFKDAKIYASNDLDESTIASLHTQGAKIDVYGVGTKLITAFDQPALGAVYKLVAIENEEGELEDTIKISGNPEKLTTPGKKKVYRIINTTNHRSEGDYITLENEDPNQEERLKMFHPIHTYISKFVTCFEAIELHHTIFQDGQLVYQTPSLTDIQDYAEKQLELLWDEYKRTINPEEYPVDLSTKTWENKMKKIERVRNNIRK